MNPEKRARFIERSALRAARKELDRDPSHRLTRDELLRLKIPSLSWPVRILLIAVGLLAVGAGIALALLQDDSAFLALCLLGFVVWPGITGRRHTLETTLEGLGHGGGEVLSHILQGLD